MLLWPAAARARPLPQCILAGSNRVGQPCLAMRSRMRRRCLQELLNVSTRFARRTRRSQIERSIEALMSRSLYVVGSLSPLLALFACRCAELHKVMPDAALVDLKLTFDAFR